MKSDKATPSEISVAMVMNAEGTLIFKQGHSELLRVAPDKAYYALNNMERWKAIEKYAARVISGFNDGVWCRNTDKDHESGWAVKLLPYVSSLGALQKTLASTPDQAREQAERKEQYVRALEAVATEAAYCMGNQGGGTIAQDRLKDALNRLAGFRGKEKE